MTLITQCVHSFKGVGSSRTNDLFDRSLLIWKDNFPDAPFDKAIITLFLLGPLPKSKTRLQLLLLRLYIQVSKVKSELK